MSLNVKLFNVARIMMSRITKIFKDGGMNKHESKKSEKKFHVRIWMPKEVVCETPSFSPCQFFDISPRLQSERRPTVIPKFICGWEGKTYRDQDSQRPSMEHFLRGIYDTVKHLRWSLLLKSLLR